MRFHMHRFKIDSETVAGHNHRLLGYAGSMIGFGVFHFHYFYGICSYNNHTHYFSGITGLPVKTENGHVHKMDGFLEFNNLHEHAFTGFTFEDAAYLPDHRRKEAFII